MLWQWINRNRTFDRPKQFAWLTPSSTVTSVNQERGIKHEHEDLSLGFDPGAFIILAWLKYFSYRGSNVELFYDNWNRIIVVLSELSAKDFQQNSLLHCYTGIHAINSNARQLKSVTNSLNVSNRGPNDTLLPTLHM